MQQVQLSNNHKKCLSSAHRVEQAQAVCSRQCSKVAGSTSSTISTTAQESHDFQSCQIEKALNAFFICDWYTSDALSVADASEASDQFASDAEDALGAAATALPSDVHHCRLNQETQPSFLNNKVVNASATRSSARPSRLFLGSTRQHIAATPSLAVTRL